MASPQRPAPPPLEGNDQVIIYVCLAGWAIALITIVALRNHIPASSRWWIWVCAAGIGQGVFALWYVPHLKRSRARTAERRRTALEQAARNQTPRDEAARAQES
jgi:hypothetical protein